MRVKVISVPAVGRPVQIYDEAEREAYGRFLLDLPDCNAKRRATRYVCTRAPRHRGDHVACNSRRTMARWRQR